MDERWSITVFIALCILLYVSRNWYYESGKFIASTKKHDIPINTPRRRISILAFGDSLTEGASRSQLHPYTIHLNELLQKNFPLRDIHIINKGISGDLAKNMAPRLKHALLNKNLAIILAGTNDYARVVAESERLAVWDIFTKVGPRKTNFNLPQFKMALKKWDIYETVIQLHQICHERNIRTVVVTIPDLYLEQYEFFQPYLKYRKEVNEKLQRFAKVNEKKTLFLDLARQIPLLNISVEERKKYWSDGVHFTTVGYDKMAELLFECIKDFISSQ